MTEAAVAIRAAGGVLDAFAGPPGILPMATVVLTQNGLAVAGALAAATSAFAFLASRRPALRHVYLPRRTHGRPPHIRHPRHQEEFGMRQ